MKRDLNEGVDVKHQCLSATHNELVDTCDGMRSDFVTAVSEELQELWYQYIEGSVESIAVQHFRRILADLLECTERSLTGAVIVGIEHLDQSRQEFRPIG